MRSLMTISAGWLVAGIIGAAAAETVQIEISDVERSDNQFSKQCSLSITVRNATRYRLNHLNIVFFKGQQLSFTVRSLRARSSDKFGHAVNLGVTQSLLGPVSNRYNSCSSLVNALATNPGEEAFVETCSLEGIPEGDCVDTIRVVLTPGLAQKAAKADHPFMMKEKERQTQLDLEQQEWLQSADESWRRVTTPSFCAQTPFPNGCIYGAYKNVAISYSLALARNVVPGRIAELRSRIKIACDYIRPRTQQAATTVNGIQFCPVYDATAASKPLAPQVSLIPSQQKGDLETQRLGKKSYIDQELEVADSLWSRITRMNCLSASFLTETCRADLNIVAGAYFSTARSGKFPARSQEMMSRHTQACSRVRANGPNTPISGTCPSRSP